MEHLIKDTHRKWNIWAQLWNTKINTKINYGCNGEEIKYRSFAARGTGKERYHKCCRDISYLRNQAKTNIKKYIDERLPEEYEKCLGGLTSITREAWNTAINTEDKREKIQALSLAKECYSMKLDLLTNATVVDDAISFVSEYNNRKAAVVAEEETTTN